LGKTDSIWPSWLDELLIWMSLHHVGDLSGVVGVFISVVGFLVTLLTLSRTKKAAEAAADAARQAKDNIKLMDAVAGFGEAVAIIEEMKRHHRNNALQLIPDRCSTVKKILISTKISNQDLSESHQTIIQDCLVTLASIEKTVDDAVINQKKLDPVRLNKILSNKADSLVGILSELKGKTNGGGNGFS